MDNHIFDSKLFNRNWIIYIIFKITSCWFKVLPLSLIKARYIESKFLLISKYFGTKACSAFERLWIVHKKPLKYYRETDQNLRFNVFLKSGLRFSLDFKYSIVSFYEKISYKSFLVFFSLKEVQSSWGTFLLFHLGFWHSKFFPLSISQLLQQQY